MSDPKVSEALTKLLCSNGGQLSRTQLSELLELSVEQIDQVLLEEAHRFPVLSEDLVVARSPVRLCTEYMRGQPEEDGCGKLHLCNFHIRGRCWNKKSKCKLGHNIQSEHNLTVLKNNEISLLTKKELKVLLLQNDHSLLPGVCWKNIHEGCDQGDACRKLHVCGFFIKGECYRRDCKFSHNLHDPTLSLILKRSGYTNVNIQNLQMLCVLKNKETLQLREGLRKFVPKARKQIISVYNMGLKAQKPSMSSNDTAYRKTGIQAMNSHWTDNEYYSDKDHWNILEEQPKIFISSKEKGEQGSPHSSNIAGIQALNSHWTDNEYSVEDHWNILEEQPKIFISSKAKGEEGSPHSSNIAGESVMTSTTVNSSVPLSSASVGHSPISIGSSSLINKSATISAQKTDFSLNANVSDSIPIYSKLHIPNNGSASAPSMVQQSTSTTDNVKTPVPASSQQNNSGANTFPNVSSTSSSNPQQNTFANADFIKNVSTAAPPVSQPITSTNNATNASSSLTSNQQITFSKLYETLNKPAASIQPSQRTPSAALTTRSPVHGTLSYRTAAARGYRKVSSYGVTELDLYTDVRSSVSSPVDSTTTLSKGIQALNSHWTDNEYSDEDHWNILEEQPKIFISSKAKGEEGSPHSSNIAGESVMTSTTVNLSVPLSSASVGHSPISIGSSSLINKSATISAQKTDFSLNANVSDSIPIYSKLHIPNNGSASAPSMVQQSTSTTDNVKTPVPASSQQNNSGANTFPNVSSTSSSNPQQNTFANADFIKNVSTAAPPVSQPITSTNNATNASSSLTSNQQITFSKLYETLNKPAASIQPSQRTPSAALTTRSPVHGTLSYRTAAARGYRKVSYGVTELDLYTDVRSSVSSPVDSTTTLSKVNQNDIFNKKSNLAKIYDVKEICVFNVWDYCKLGINCGEMHYHLPYRWQYLDGTEWKDLSHMEETEKAYSDPSMDRGHLVDFRTMKSGTSEARRLSTASSVTKPSQYSLTTEWLWYWKDETGSWIQYGDMNIKQQSASISSDDLETVYLANPKDVCPFQAGSQSYEINFKEMVQRNLVYKTQREVRRRPQYRSLDDVRQLRRSSNATPAISSKETGVYPSHWDSSALPDIGYKLVNVSPTSTEYMDIRKMFLKTMPHQAVMKIRRIQNPSLWKFFQLQKEQMKKVNKGKNVDERQLFHGTNNSHIQTICNENFDWRICGTNGTMYGKGSYFARDASYSHNYSNPDIGGKRSMFVTRVLVGDFVRGDPTMKRPPYKSNSTNQSYDSCVDTTYNPSIFVVFEKHQIYPEYLMEYAQCQWYEETKVDKTVCCIS